MKKWFSEKTLGLRRDLVFGVINLFTPRLLVEVREHLRFVDGVPRPFTLMLKKEFGDKPLKGCEIGFGSGVNAVSLLEELNIEKLYCVEPYLGKAYRQGSKLVERYVDSVSSSHTIFGDGRVAFIKKTSDEAFSSKSIPRGLDFIYVDGNHDYRFVLGDILNAFYSVEKNGFVGGHDFYKQESGVVEAVFEFARVHQIIPTVKMPDFWFKKTVRF